MAGETVTHRNSYTAKAKRAAEMANKFRLQMGKKEKIAAAWWLATSDTKLIITALNFYAKQKRLRATGNGF